MKPTTSAHKQIGWNSLLGILVLIFAGAMLASRTAAAKASPPPLAVGLVSFRATPLDSAVRLEWITGTEQNTAGFKIQRVNGSESVFLTPVELEALNSEQIEPFPPEGHAFIWSKGTPASGATYTIRDTSAINGVTYTYWLVEVESDSNEIAAASITVTAGIPTATPTSTPVVISGNPSGITPVIDPSSVASLPTRTPRSTATPVPSLTASPAISGEPTAPRVESGTSSPAPTSIPPSNVPATGIPSASNSPKVTQPDSIDFLEDSSRKGDPSELGTVQIVAAQTEPEPTQPVGYPGPTEITVPADSDAFDPPEPLTPTESVPYPAGNPAEVATPFAIIGSQEDVMQSGPNSGVADNRVLLGRIYLWGAFFIASLIFVTAVIGSVILFTRRQS